MPRKPTNGELLSYCAVLLTEFNNPVHYIVLTKALIESEMWSATASVNPAQIVYSALHADVVKLGKLSQFRFLGCGIFCSALVKDIDLVSKLAIEIRQNRRKYDPAKRKYARRQYENDSQYEDRMRELTANPHCGNCKYMRFENLQIIKRQRGTCQNYTLSQRVGVTPDKDVCDFWKMRSEAQRRRDIRERDAQITALEKINEKKNRAR